MPDGDRLNSEIASGQPPLTPNIAMKCVWSFLHVFNQLANVACKEIYTQRSVSLFWTSRAAPRRSWRNSWGVRTLVLGASRCC